ncbi:MAG: efflux transporter outer membrane subunit [Myxococcota bacterium]
MPVAYRVWILPPVLLLTNCSVGPEYRRPPGDVDNAWLEAENPALNVEAPAHDRWWSVFNDATLGHLVRHAYQENLTLEAAGLRVIQARARRGIAAGEFFPQAQSLGADIGQTSISDNDANAALLDRNFATGSIGLDVAWELDFWGKFRRGIESADATLLASIATYDDVLVSVLAEVASTYVEIRTLERRIELLRANIALQQDSLDIAEVRFRNGVTTELDVTEARSTLANTQAALPDLDAQLRSAKLALGVLLAKKPSELGALLGQSHGIPSAPASIAVGAPANLLRRRPDVRLRERLAAAQSARIGVATANLYPSISIAGSTGLSTSNTSPPAGIGAGIGDLFDADSFGGFIGLGVDWPLLNYGRVKNNIRVQDAAYQQAVAEYKATVLAAAAEVESSLYGYLQAQDQRKRLNESVDAAARTLDLATIQYTQGVVAFIRVNDANTFLTIQQDNEAVVQGVIAQQLIRSFKALGGGWEIRAGREFIPQKTIEQMRERTDWGDLLDPDYAEGRDLIFKRPVDEQKQGQPDTVESQSGSDQGEDR